MPHEQELCSSTGCRRQCSTRFALSCPIGRHGLIMSHPTSVSTPARGNCANLEIPATDLFFTMVTRSVNILSCSHRAEYHLLLWTFGGTHLVLRASPTQMKVVTYIAEDVPGTSTYGAAGESQLKQTESVAKSRPQSSQNWT